MNKKNATIVLIAGLLGAVVSAILPKYSPGAYEAFCQKETPAASQEQ